MQLGTQKAGDILEISEKDRSTHMHVIGGTGRGKSQFLYTMLKQDIINNQGLCLLDPHGELYEQLVDWMSINKLLVKRRKIHLLNLSDIQNSFGFNPLKASSEDALPFVIDSTASGISHVWGGGDLTQTPLIKDTLERVLYALAESDLTIAEARYLTSYEEQEAREKIISQLNNPEYATAWKDSHLKNARDFNLEFEATQRRFRGLLSSPIIRNILGQKDDTIDFKKAMDEGEIILVNLAPNENLSPENARVIGTLLLNDMYLSAIRRKPSKSKRFYLYMDEAQQFLSERVEEILVGCRKFGLSLVLAHQHLQQLKEQGDLIYSSVLANTGLKVAFGQLNHKDADEIAKEIYMGKYDPHRINPATLKPVVVDHEVIELNSISETKTIGESQAESEGESSGSSEGFGTSEGSGEMQAIGTGLAEQSLITEGDFTENILNSETLGNSETSANSSFSGSSSSSSYSNATSRARARGESRSQGKTIGYSESLKPIIEERGNPYTLQEQEKLFADAIGTQNPRLATVRTPEGQVGQFRTLDATTEFTTPRIKKKLVEKLIDQSPIIATRQKAQAEIEQRQNSLKEKEVIQKPLIDDLKDEDFLS